MPTTQNMVALLEALPGYDWLQGRLQGLKDADSARDLYMAYTLCAQHFADTPMKGAEQTHSLFGIHPPSEKEYARLSLLHAALEDRAAFYTPKVLKLIQVADTGELITFLRYLVVLPEHKEFVFAAVEALRTNIADVFEAIALNNPYPKAFFNEQQWNQMYLKAAFMQLDLTQIDGVEERANNNLTRIISDYAHERWAASRQIDPCIWRPVSPFLDAVLLADMRRLFGSDYKAERLAGYLVAKKAESADLQEEIKHNAALETEIPGGNPWETVRDLWTSELN